ncbi:MAG: imidazole glycerol phosphate synthase subunit HisF [Candidatus Bathyarchaeia archaeon]|nr:imidazole glycerol phosphate synthase subunit HisF [Candidatus Bathyarchaeota archaeon]
MLTKRIIPCLDVDKGKVVKGIRFENLRVEGDPAELAQIYDEEGADEIIFLDVTASYEDREILIDAVRRTAEVIYIPFTVGGGVRSIEDIRVLLSSGADRVSINTAAVRNPQLVRESSEIFGSQCIVVAIDAKRRSSPPGSDQPFWWEVYVEGGRKPTGIDAVSWAREVERLGAGEIMLTSMDYDGTREGYDLALTERVSTAVRIPVIASGGAGKLEHIYDALTEGKADAALAASIFHEREYTVAEVKEYLKGRGVPVRMDWR